jgi:hypothetical protein
MININTYIKSLHCSWLKKATQSSIDNWRVDLQQLSGGNPVNADPEQIPVYHPILKTITGSFHDFKGAFFRTGKNLLYANFLDNPCLVNNKREKIRVKDDIFHNNLVNGEYLSNIKIGDLLTGTENFKSIEDVRLIVRYEMQGQQYERLKTCVLDSLKLNKKFMNTDSALELTSFLKRFKKGSKQFRKIFDCFADSQLKK